MKNTMKRLTFLMMIGLLVLGLVGVAAGANAAPVAQSDDEDVTLATAKASVEMVQDGRAIVLARGNRILVDSVPPLDGPNEEMNPFDLLLGSLGACGAFVYEAAAQEMDIPLNSLTMGVEADFAPAGVQDGSVNPRVRAFRAAATADGPSMEEMEMLADQWRLRCPIYTTLELAAPIEIVNRLKGEGTAVLDVDFTYAFDTADEYIAEVSPMAEMFAAVPGLVWKTWTLNPETKRAGAVYLFENPEIRQAYMDGDLFAAVKGHPALSEYRIQTYDVMRSESLVTHAPLRSESDGMDQASEEPGVILDVAFTYAFDTADEYIAEVSPMAEQFEAVPGLVWKTWTLNPDTKRAGAVYYFESADARDAYMDGDLFGAVKNHPALSDIDITTFDVMAAESAVTRGPIGTTNEMMGSEQSAGANVAPTVTFTAANSAYDGPDSIPGGLTRIEFTNTDEKEHTLWLVKRDEGKTFDDVLGIFAALGTDPDFPEWAVWYGGVSAGPGETRSYTIDLAPGAYSIFSFSANADGVPEMFKGFSADLTVTEAEGNEATPPSADLRTEMVDFSYILDGAPVAGPAIVEVTNTGTDPHEALVYKLDEGVSVQDAMDFMMAGEDADGPPPFTAVGSMAPISTGLTAWYELEFESGDYGLFCFIPSPANEGTPHFMLGMIAQVTVE